MTRTIAIVSGKGGVGKTTIVANLGLALASLGKSVILLDADLDMANLELALDMAGRPITMQEVLTGESTIADATYEVATNMKFIPAGVSIEQYRRVDPEKLAKVVAEGSTQADFVLIDCPAGMGRDTMACLSAAKENIIIAMPEPMSAVDAFKTKMTGEKMGSETIGLAINQIRKIRGEESERDMQTMLEAPIIARIPYDNDLKISILEKKPLFTRKPNSPAMIEIAKIAAHLTGIEFKPPEKGPGLLQSILSKLPFGRKTEKPNSQATQSAKQTQQATKLAMQAKVIQGNKK